MSVKRLTPLSVLTYISLIIGAFISLQIGRAHV